MPTEAVPIVSSYTVTQHLLEQLSRGKQCTESLIKEIFIVRGVLYVYF